MAQHKYTYVSESAAVSDGFPFGRVSLQSALQTVAYSTAKEGAE